jgi:hypothetical protein
MTASRRATSLSDWRMLADSCDTDFSGPVIPPNLTHADLVVLAKAKS